MSSQANPLHNGRAGFPARRILVVSDNPDLSLFMQAEFEKYPQRALLRVDFAYTAFNKAPQNMQALGAQAINMKDEATVARVAGAYDLVFSLHCKQIFPAALVNRVCCINFHPGLNPYNRGWYPQAFSILNGLPAGATIHVMDAQVDHGAIIAQQAIEIAVSDTSLEAYQKVIAAEKRLIAEHLPSLIEGRFSARAPAQEGNYNGIQDFNALCKLDLNAVGTLGEHLRLLRATTHGDFKNAYFTDDSGRRFFVRIQIEPQD